MSFETLLSAGLSLTRRIPLAGQFSQSSGYLLPVNAAINRPGANPPEGCIPSHVVGEHDTSTTLVMSAQNPVDTARNSQQRHHSPHC
jgi:hypothetical protein